MEILCLDSKPKYLEEKYIVERKEIIICNDYPEAKCLGSSDGKVFRYSNGIEDQGQLKNIVTAIINNWKLIWVE